VRNLFGTDLPGIIASVESERGATAATIAQDVGSTYRLGRLYEAVETFPWALSLDRAWVSVRLDHALTLLVRGDEDDVVQEYEAGMAHLATREPGQRLGPLLVASDDLGEAPHRAQPLHRSQAAGIIRAQFERAALAATAEVPSTEVSNAFRPPAARITW